MQNRFTTRTAATLASLAGLALIMSACSDTATTAPRLSAPGGAAFTAGPTADVGPVQISLNSSAATQLCTAQTAIGTYPPPAAPFGPFAGCGTAFDLAAQLAIYNPGWSAPFASTTWIGPNATSNEYKTAPGRYVFQHTFTIPVGATSPVLNISTKSDNAITVFLNGFLVNTQVIADCVTAPCNWDAGGTFVSSDNTHLVTGTNTVTIALVDTPNGGNAGNSYACLKLPQPNGSHGFTNDGAVPTYPDHVYVGFTPATTLAQYAAAGCLNPTGLDYHGTVSYLTVVTTWCSPGFWKNAGRDLWSVYWNKRYSTLVGAAPLSKKAPLGYDPTLLEVIDNPSVYGGPATNSVADFLSNKAFGTPIGSGVESCPNPDDIRPLVLPVS